MNIPNIPNWVFAAAMIVAVLTFLWSADVFAFGRKLAGGAWSKLSTLWTKPHVPEQPPEDEEQDWDLVCFNAYRLLQEDATEATCPKYIKAIRDAGDHFMNRHGGCDE